jgi:transposase
MAIILAIDLAKAKSLFCWFDTTDQSHRFETVASTPQAFHEALLEQKVDRVVIEVCDMAGWVMDLCKALSIPIQIANVNVEGWRWKHVKTKTDKADALKLARLSAANDLKLVYLPDRTTRQWRGTILYRHRLVERRTRIKNSIHALLVAEGRAMSGGRDAFNCESLSALRQLARPMSECSKEQLWSGHLWMELEQLDELSEQIDLLDKKLNELGDADHRVIRLQTIPGVGPRLSELVVAMIDDPKRFKNGREVSAYAGLVPRRYQSGQMDRSGRISKQGCGKLRKLLLEIAWGMLQHNTHGRAVFNRISKGQKTRRKQAAVALGRRVLVWCWAMLRDQTDWRDPSQARPGQARRVEPACAAVAPAT